MVLASFPGTRLCKVLDDILTVGTSKIHLGRNKSHPCVATFVVQDHPPSGRTVLTRQLFKPMQKAGPSLMDSH